MLSSLWPPLCTIFDPLFRSPCSVSPYVCATAVIGKQSYILYRHRTTTLSLTLVSRSWKCWNTCRRDAFDLRRIPERHAIASKDKSSVLYGIHTLHILIKNHCQVHSKCLVNSDIKFFWKLHFFLEMLTFSKNFRKSVKFWKYFRKFCNFKKM